MSFEEYAKKKLRKTAYKFNNVNLGTLPKLNDKDIEKQVNLTYNITRFVFITAECLILGWFFMSYMPDKYGWAKTYGSLLTSLVIFQFIRLFQKSQ